MTKKLLCMILAVLTVFSLAACGQEVSVEDSQPEALQTFGEHVEATLPPSGGEINPDSPVTLPDTEGDVVPVIPGGETGQIGEGDDTVIVASPAPSTTPAATAAPTKKPTASAAPSEEPSPSPTIAPPEPASTATAEQATEFIGSTLTEMIGELGYPLSSNYERIDEDDPSKGEIGTLVFVNGFVVSTKKTAEGEFVTGVSRTGAPVEEPVEEDSPEDSAPEEVPEGEEDPGAMENPNNYENPDDAEETP